MDRRMDWRCIGESLFPVGCVGSCGHELIVMIPSPLLIKLKSRHCRFTMGLIVAWFSVLVMGNEIVAWPANSFAFLIVIIYRGNLTVRTDKGVSGGKQKPDLTGVLQTAQIGLYFVSREPHSLVLYAKSEQQNLTLSFSSHEFSPWSHHWHF